MKLIEFIDAMPGDRVSNKICDQLIRSGTSVIGNYTEGKSASSRKDFTNYLTISLKSANESKLWFALLRDSNKAKKEEVQWFLNELDEISRILASSVLTLKSKK